MQERMVVNQVTHGEANPAVPSPASAENQHPKEVNSRTDTRSDGSVDTGKIQALIHRAVERTGRTVDIDTVVKAADANSDGRVSESEFSATPDFRVDPSPVGAHGEASGGYKANETVHVSASGVVTKYTDKGPADESSFVDVLG